MDSMIKWLGIGFILSLAGIFLVALICSTMVGGWQLVWGLSGYLIIIIMVWTMTVGVDEERKKDAQENDNSNSE